MEQPKSLMPASRRGKGVAVSKRKECCVSNVLAMPMKVFISALERGRHTSKSVGLSSKPAVRKAASKGIWARAIC